MGGGGDSRIPSILKEHINPYIEKCYTGMADKGVAALETGCPHVSVVVRTYSFDPEVAWGQISSWMEELKPALVVGESLGSLNAIRIKGVPHILVSPSLNAPVYLGYLAFLALIPGVTQLFDRIYRPKDGDRPGQAAVTLSLHFSAPVTITAAAALSASVHGGNISARPHTGSMKAPISWKRNLSFLS